MSATITTRYHTDFINRGYDAGTPVRVITSREEHGFQVSLVEFPQGEQTWMRSADLVVR